MTQQYVPGIGKLIEEDVAFRDAIHVAVAPATAGETLRPGQHVWFYNGIALADGPGAAVGIVDPFLPISIGCGLRFWLFLYPGTAANLRHAWTHPAFGPAAPRSSP